MPFIQSSIMTRERTERRGGRRENAGREVDYLRRCELLAIQWRHECSESTARRMLKDAGGNIALLVTGGPLESLMEWNTMNEFNQGFVYGILHERVAEMRRRGIGRRI